MLRSRQLDKKPIDVHAVINESLALVAHDLSARQIEATVDLPPGPCIVNGDQVLLQQVLVNLVINAMDAMAETPPARRRITISSELRAEEVDISVRDTGHGFAGARQRHAVHAVRDDEVERPRHRPDDRPDHRRGAWRRHRRPQQSRRRRDVYGHAAPQRAAESSQGRQAQHDIRCPAAAPSRPRVLIADDHPDMVKAISRLLALDCDVVGSVADGRAASRGRGRLHPDVIVLDLNLPNGDGLETCRQIATRHPEIRVIVFTAVGDPALAERSLEIGASAFVSKLEGNRHLLSTIKRLCGDPD